MEIRFDEFKMKNEKPFVSVIIPTNNSEATLEKCLESIRNQTYPNVDIIVVDGFSTDNTKKIAQDWGARIIEIEAKRSEARNTGVEKSSREWVLFVDSDMALSSSVIGECVGKIREGYDAAIIPEVSVGEGFWAECKALEKMCYIGDDTIEAARFFRRSVFDIVGGYDPELEAGEDWDLSRRINKGGYRIGRIHAFIQHHEGRLSLRDTMLNKRLYGKTLNRYRVKHLRDSEQPLRLIRPAFVRNRRKLLKHPIHAIGMLFMKTCEFGAGALGMLIGNRSIASSRRTNETN